MNGISTQADVSAIEAKLNLNTLPASTYDMIRQGASINPQAPALSFFLQAKTHHKPETWTYAQLLKQITQTANFFYALGARQSTVIAYILPNLPETHFVLWGGQAAGIVMAINPLLEPPAIAELLQAAGVSILVTLAPFPGTDLWQKVQQVVSQVTTLEHIVMINLADRMHGIKGLVAHALQKREQYRLYGLSQLKHHVPKHIHVHDYHRKVWLYPKTRLRSKRKILPSDYSSYFCTGGTTGTPKIALRTHGNEVANVWSASQFLGNGITPGKTVFCGLPLFHVNGVLITGLLPFSKGAHVLLGTPQGYRGEGVVSRFWEIVAHHRINFFSGVPTLYASLLQVPIANHQVDSLEYGLCGAAPMPPEVMRSFQEHTGLKILEGYGLTEGTCVSSVNPPLGERRLGSIGLRIPAQAMKAVILDDQGNYCRDCAIDEVGELVICGPNVFSGYKLAEQNESLWVETGDSQRWLNTGDLGKQDAEGYFYLTGRKKELIIRGGHNIDPLSIEEPMLKHPAVALAAAVGRPDIHAGELPVVYVQLKDNQTATEAELLKFAQTTIMERAALPKQVRIIKQIPLTAVGKIYKVSLKQQEIHSALCDALQQGNTELLDLQVFDDKTQGIVIQGTAANDAIRLAATRILENYPFKLNLRTHETTTD